MRRPLPRRFGPIWSGCRESARRRSAGSHISTDKVFGSLGPSGRFSETTSYYWASKAASDHLVNAWHDTYGLLVVLINLKRICLS